MNKIISLIILLIGMIVYLKTVSPTLSFWDCGEFIAAAYTMGVPHPPGSPFFLMLGRLFSLIPFDNIGWRVNLLSVFSSAVTVMLLYLTIVRMIRWSNGWKKPYDTTGLVAPEQSNAEKIAVYGGAAIGALTFAFSHSFWFNAVEAEVYAMSMFFTAIVFWLALLWLDHSDDPLGNRILLLILYLVGLSIGVHLLNVLALLAIAYIISAHRFDLNVRTVFWTGVVGSIITVAMYPILIQGLPMIVVKASYWSIIIVLIGLIILAVWAVRNDHRFLGMGSVALLLIIIGYSTYLYIKIRSGLNPFLDENDPETWASLLSYLNREQYGSESLILGMFERKAPFWSYQINKMYLRYLSWQFLYYNEYKPVFYIFPFIFGLYGMVRQFSKHTKGAIPVLMLFVMTGLAIILYVNQDDPQPRERDYSYVGSFYAFAIWIGFGAMAGIQAAIATFKKFEPRMVAAVATGVLIAALPLQMLIQNYKMHDRSGNYVAWDYSYNLLNSCEPDAVLYTNGDNDTFPLWYLQNVENIRPDVRVANLSLLNTGWFIQQIRDKEPKVPMTTKVSDLYLQTHVDARDMTGLMDRVWGPTKKMKLAGPTLESPPMEWDVPAGAQYPLGQGKTGYFLRVQDWMILNTMVANKWQKPMQFAVTCPDNNLVGLRDMKNPSKNFLTMDGLTFRLNPVPSPMIHPELMADNLMRKYKYRNVNNPNVFYMDSEIKLLGNYRQAFLQLALHYMEQSPRGMPQDSTGLELPLEERVSRFEALPPRVKALTLLDFMEDRIPEDLVEIKYDIVSLQIGRIYAQLGRPAEMKRRLDRLSADPANLGNAYEYGLYYLVEGNAPDEARRMFDYALQLKPSFEYVTRIASLWVQFQRDHSYPTEIFERWLQMDKSRTAQTRIAEQAITLGMYDFAISVYTAMRQANPDDAVAIKAMIDLYHRTGKIQEALTLADEYLAKNPNDAGITAKRNDLRSALTVR